MIKNIMFFTSILFFNFFIVSGSSAQSTDELKMVMMTNYIATDPEVTKWERVKSTRYGMRIVTLYGDPSKPGLYAYRLKMPSGYKLPPHYFEEAQSVTVLKGTYWTGIGDKTNPMNLREFNTGAFFTTKGNVPRYTWARTEVIIQVMGEGPSSGIKYVNPGDDPRK
ncbi:MAG: hypothetical protein CMK56_01490 [Proteobacteria bacterium]|nr:hypothetical protein [Pseudomonadota bacterium]